MVPDGWTATQVGNIAKFSSGGTPSKKNLSYWGGVHPWISGKDLKQHYLYSSIDKLTDEGFKNAKQAPMGATLILVRGMTLLKDFPVGYTTKRVSFNQDIKALIPNEGVDALYLSFLLAGNKNLIKQLVSTAGHGTGRLDSNSIKAFPVNVPPLPEQKKIAKILSTWDSAIEVTEKLLSNSQKQKKSLMQQLLTGKKRLPGFGGEWEEFLLSELGATYSGLSGKSKSDFGKGSPFIPYMNIFKNSRIDINILELVNVKQGEKQHRVNYGDIFFTTSSETPEEVGMSSVLLDHINEVYLNSFCFGFRLYNFESFIPEFARYFLRGQGVRRDISVLAQGATRYNLSKIQLMKMKLRLPPTEEQQKIASVLSTADKDIETLQQKLNCLKQEKKALMQQLLTGKRRVMVDDEGLHGGVT